MRRRGPGRPRSRPDRVRGDKAYSSRDNRAYLRSRGIKATTAKPDDQRAHHTRRGRSGGWPPAFDKTQYRHRNAVERCINTWKQYRAVATHKTNATTSLTAPSPPPRPSSGSTTPSKSHQKRPRPTAAATQVAVPAGWKAHSVAWTLPEPLLTTPAPGPYLRPGWAGEPKWDGFRALLSVDAGRVIRRSIRGTEMGPTFTEVVAGPAQLRTRPRWTAS
ncbi:hypothetical protein ACIQI8_42570 [Streptomyces sp. NPDC092369]|uniref:hypothetical protein n=1 Tax=Streptomyces sp. NPDC092369 TaxID=3366015 RepID=UPI0037F5A17F